MAVGKFFGKIFGKYLIIRQILQTCEISKNYLKPFWLDSQRVNQYKKSNKAQFIIYTDLECLIDKIDRPKNNPENSSTTKVGKLFHQLFQCLQYHRSKAKKIGMIYTEVKLAWKSFVNS